MIITKIKYLILLLTVPIIIQGQQYANQSKIDSLLYLIDNTDNDSTLLSSYNSISDLLINEDHEASINYLQNLIEICEQLLLNKETVRTEKQTKYYNRQIAWGNFRIGQILNYYLEYDRSIPFIENAIRKGKELKWEDLVFDSYDVMHFNFYSLNEYENGIRLNDDYYDYAIEHNNKMHQSTSLYYKGWVYFEQRLNNEARLYFEKSLQLAEEANIPERIARSEDALGSILLEEGNHFEAIKYFMRSLNTYEKIGDIAGIAYVNVCLANIYIDQREYDKSLKHLDVAITIKEDNNPDYELIDNDYEYVLTSQASAYSGKGDLQMAKNLLLKAIKSSLIKGNNVPLAESWIALGDLYLQEAKIDSAKLLFTKALNLSKELNFKDYLAESLSGLGRTCLQQKKYDCAENYLLRAKRRYEELKSLNGQKDVNHALYQCYEQNGNSKKALTTYKSYIGFRDSLSREENEREVIKQEYSYQYDKKAFADSLYFAQEQKEIATQLSVQKQRSWFLFAGLGLTVLFGGFIFNRYKVTQNQKRIIEIERDKSDKLLLNILPRETAEELKSDGKVTAKSYEEATVLFSDFVDFTKLSSQHSPHELVSLIDEYFTAFDKIMIKHSVEKIKTVGDAYMAVSGIPNPNPNHAYNCMNAAFEMMDAVKSINMIKKEQSLPYFDMRIGIHSGPLTSGVVGENKFQYDVWGDSVNIASRIESTSERNKINISQSFYDLIEQHKDIKITPRGPINAKGKGVINMYFLEHC